MPSHPKVLPCTESRSSPSSSVMSPPFSSNQPPSLEAPSLEGSNATSKPPLTEGSKPPPVNLDESVTESKVTDTLNLAVAHAHSLRMRISVASVCFGTVPMLAGNIIYYLLEFFVLSPQKWGSSGYWGSMIAGMGFVMLLGVMPNDDKIIRTLNLIGTVSLIQVGAVCICLALNALIRNPEIPDRSPNTMCSSSTSAACRLFVIKYCLLAVVYILGGLMVCSSLRRIPNAKGFAEDQFVVPARLALEGIWLYTRTTIAIAGGIFFVLAIVMFYDESANAEYYSPAHARADCFMAIVWLLSVAFYSPARRRATHAFLGSLNVSGEAHSAAAVAALIGNMPPKESLALAKQKFRTMDFSILRKEDFIPVVAEKKVSQKASVSTENVSTNTLFDQTAATRLGECDGFISHSWSDDGEKKFQVLSRWASDFEKLHHRPPQVWLDKCCIDQLNIEQNLQVLPVFLAGCKSLVIVAGESYCERLWCIMECFVFLKMGGDVERITILPLNMEGGEAREMFKGISVEKCKCYSESDKQKLCAIIEQGFGDFQEFNEIVRHVFVSRLKVVKRRFSFGNPNSE